MKTTLGKNDRGFIFSLDASLALLVVLIVVAGVARIGEGGLAYEQQGYLRLERYANDTLETMILTGSMDNLIDQIAKGDNTAARALARAELGKALPSEVQFKLVVGDNFEVYPSDNIGWSTTFASMPELAVAARVTPRFTRATTARILAWLGDSSDQKDELDDNFMTAVQTFAQNTGADWQVMRVYREADFWNELRKPPLGYRTYDVVFMPDVEVDFHNNKTWWLIEYSHLGGRQGTGGKLVVGGKTLWYNYGQTGGTWDWYLWWRLGVVGGFGTRPQNPAGFPELQYMTITDDTRYVTLPYDNGDQIEYAFNYEQYVYTPRDGILDLFDRVHVVAQWKNSPAGGPTPPWPGIISVDGGWILPNLWSTGPSVLFNMRLTQSAMGPNPTGTNDWVQLAARAIGYLGTSELKPVTLYVWRRQEAS